ncbi:MAG: 50S ribosomal protein L9 [Bacilli bacterium]|nr:50S ribosomal protein L9 [Bacilli bacterium]
MKIILLKDVKKQGKSGDILNVKDGYGTFLINKGDAVLATNNSMDRLDRENKEKEKQELNLIKKCEEIKKKLEKLTITFKVKTGEQDRVFGSISAKQIVEELKGNGYEIDKKQIKIDGSISSLGFHAVDVELHKKVVAKLKIELKK